ncbi:MAG: YdcF family protein [Bacillota bacterium]
MRLARNIVIFFIVSFLLLMYSPLQEYLALPLVVKDKPRRAEAIVVLSGGWESRERLGKSTLERYNYAIRLFQDGFAPLLIFSGGNLDNRPAEADQMAEMALSDGFSYQAIVSENSSSTTWENVLFTKRILKENKITHVILVTSPYHMRRAKTMFEEKGVKVTALPVPDSELYTAKGSRRLELTKVILLEYVKFGLYKIGIPI